MSQRARAEPARRSLVDAWRARAPDAIALLGPDPRDAVARREAVAHAGHLHPAARATLLAQNPEAEALVERLARGVAVVTGQQPGLFGGPLYTLLKAASAIALAARLERETGRAAVAVFWVQAEDHDLEEVRRHRLLGTDDRLVEVSVAGDEARISLAHRRLGVELDPALAQIEAALAGAPFEREVVSALRASHRVGRTYPDAFADWLRRALAGAPLLVLMPRTAAIGEALAPLQRWAFDEAEGIEGALRARVDALDAAGFSAQVPPRAGATLSFVHPDGTEHPRYRAVREADGLRLAGDGRRWSRSDLALASPLQLSTSALLRPLAQDRLLPTAALVAGPSELAYLAELPPLYAMLGMRPPLFVPRVHGRWLPADDAARLGRAQPSAETFAPTGLLAQELLADRPELDLLRSLPGALDVAVQARREAASNLDPSLGAAVDKTRAAAVGAAEKLLSRALRAALSQDVDARARLAALEARHLPGGVPQERGLGWPSIAARVGPAALASALLAVDALSDEPFALEV